jgi:ABC-type lipopolysaccharide export system ATPase subunit
MNESIPAIHIQQLTKTYDGGLTALKGINLSVKQGEFFALLGPNGAGKSTTIGILCSLVNKTSGSVSICGHNIDTDWSRAKTCLGVVPQEFNFNIFEPCWQIVVNQAGYYGVPRDIALKRVDILFEQLGLSEKRNEQAKNLLLGELLGMEYGETSAVHVRHVLEAFPPPRKPSQLEVLAEIIRALDDTPGLSQLPPHEDESGDGYSVEKLREALGNDFVVWFDLPHIVHVSKPVAGCPRCKGLGYYKEGYAPIRPIRRVDLLSPIPENYWARVVQVECDHKFDEKP